METWLVIPFVICLVKCIQTNNKSTLEILDVLKKYGLTKNPPKKTNLKQFVSVTVLSEAEYTDLSWIKAGKFLESFTERRVVVQFNENKNTIHGEKIILDTYLEGLTREMKRDCKFRCAAVVCLFSWYIPCSLANNQCAVKLKKDVNSKKYKLIIGFTEVFWDTRGGRGPTLSNLKESFKTLSHENIDVFYLVNFYSGQISKRGEYKEPITHLSEILQSNLYDCIIQKPVSFCCGSNYNETFPGLTDLLQVEKITAFSINTMFYDCSSRIKLTKSLDKRMKKTFELTNSLAKTLNECFSGWIQNNIGASKNCKKCWTKSLTYHYFVEKCINRAFATSLFIGKPHDDEDQSLNKWDDIKSPKNWNEFQKSYKKYIKASKIKCFKENLHPGTFCTKTDRISEGDNICRVKKIGKTRR